MTSPTQPPVTTEVNGEQAYYLELSSDQIVDENTRLSGAVTAGETVVGTIYRVGNYLTYTAQVDIVATNDGKATPSVASVSFTENETQKTVEFTTVDYEDLPGTTLDSLVQVSITTQQAGIDVEQDSAAFTVNAVKPTTLTLTAAETDVVRGQTYQFTATRDASTLYKRVGLTVGLNDNNVVDFEFANGDLNTTARSANYVFETGQASLDFRIDFIEFGPTDGELTLTALNYGFDDVEDTVVLRLSTTPTSTTDPPVTTPPPVTTEPPVTTTTEPPTTTSTPTTTTPPPTTTLTPVELIVDVNIDVTSIAVDETTSVRFTRSGGDIGSSLTISVGEDDGAVLSLDRTSVTFQANAAEVTATVTGVAAGITTIFAIYPTEGSGGTQIARDALTVTPAASTTEPPPTTTSNPCVDCLGLVDTSTIVSRVFAEVWPYLQILRDDIDSLPQNPLRAGDPRLVQLTRPVIVGGHVSLGGVDDNVSLGNAVESLRDLNRQLAIVALYDHEVNS